MKVYQTNNTQAEVLQKKPFQSEREIQALVERNMESMLDLDFIGDEFAVGGYRLDSIGFDVINKSFTIIEYKKDHNFSVADQGMSYLNTLLNHKADFVLLYNQHYQKNVLANYFDWEQTQIIFIADHYTKYQLDAVDNPNFPINLYEINQYDNGIVLLNYLQKSRLGPQSIAHLDQSSQKSVNKQVQPQEINSVEKLKPRIESELMNVCDDDIYAIYQELVTKISDWDAAITRNTTKLYVSFLIRGNVFLSVIPFQNRLRIVFNAKQGQLRDQYHLTQDISNTGHWGSGEYRMDLAQTNQNQIAFVLDLVKQCFEYRKTFKVHKYVGRLKR